MTTVAPGQAGYVHYFLLTHPNGELEYHTGIEMPDQRIAWSFPGLGVGVSPFIKSGSVQGGGVEYAVEHLYGIRPFPDETRMNALRYDITYRVAQWIDDEVPYCIHPTRNGPFCVSCGDFVVRVLFPGRTYQTAVLPRDFFKAPTGAGAAPSTDDLLMWLTGFNEIPTQEARVKRLAALALPEALREDLADIFKSLDSVTTADGEAAKPPPAVQRRVRAAARGVEKAVKPPAQPAKRL